MIHTNQKIIKHKVGLLNLADELGNISKACKTMGVSRDTFYRYRMLWMKVEWKHFLIKAEEFQTSKTE